MTRDEMLVELQRRIAVAKGYRGRSVGADGRLSGVLYADEGRTLVPRWPWDMADAVRLLDDVESGSDARVALIPSEDGIYAVLVEDVVHGEAPLGAGASLTVFGRRVVGASWSEAICRCWCAWKGIDLSDLSATEQA